MKLFSKFLGLATLLMFVAMFMNISSQAQNTSQAVDKEVVAPDAQERAISIDKATPRKHESGAESRSETFKRSVPSATSGSPLIYDNGPLITAPLGGPNGTNGSVLQNSTLGMTTLGYTVAGPRFRLADDFTVTNPNGWRIDSMTVWAYQTMTTPDTVNSTITSMTFRIWDGLPDSSNLIFGDTVANVMISTAWSDRILRYSETTVNASRAQMHTTGAVGVLLPPGTYWVDWNVTGSTTSGPFAPPITIPGDTITGNGRQYDNTTGVWTNLVSRGPQGMPFQFYGEAFASPPDAFGYTSVGGVNYDFIDISSTGTLVASGDDESSVTSVLMTPVTLGAPFNFYGTEYSELVPSTNGYISTLLTDNGGDLSNDCPLPSPPSTGGGARIYPLQDDLVADSSEGGGVYYQYFAVSPRPHESGMPMGVSVFQWVGNHYPSPATMFTFEALLYDNGDIVYQIGPGNPELGSGSTTGIQNLGATTGLTYACNSAASIPDNVAIRVIFPAPATPPTGWNAQTSGVTTTLYSIKAVNPGVVWACGSGQKVVRTTDAGATWTNVGGPGVLTGDLYAIDAVDAQTALVTSTPSTTTFIYRTTDAGATWAQVYSQSGGFINAIKMFDANNGIAQGDPVGGTWTIVRTTDGGATWARIATEPAQAGSEAGAVNGLAVIGTDHIWFTPGSGSANVYRSTDGGATWASSTLPFTAFTAGLAFNDTQYGVAGGNGGQVARTTDGGATWTSVTVGGTGAVYGAAGNGLDFFITRGQTVYRSMDRGATWALSYAGGVGNPLWHVSTARYAGNVAAYTVSNTGGIAAFYGTLTGVEDGIEDGIASEYALMQNYPNPFNPSTTIRYALPEASSVTLRIYNLLGQQVAELVNEVKSAGFFQTEWNGRNQYGQLVSSGVYFYRMEAHGTNGSNVFVSEKKMLMLK